MTGTFPTPAKMQKKLFIQANTGVKKISGISMIFHNFQKAGHHVHVYEYQKTIKPGYSSRRKASMILTEALAIPKMKCENYEVHEIPEDDLPQHAERVSHFQLQQQRKQKNFSKID